MAALILGVAASPAFSNGFAYADEPVEAPESVEGSPEYSERELKELQSAETRDDKRVQREAEAAREAGARLSSGDKDDTQVKYSTTELKALQSDASKQDKVEQREAADLKAIEESRLNSEDKDTEGPSSSERHGRR